MKNIYDSEAIMSDLSLNDLLDATNIPHRMKGKYHYVLCPFHADKNFGSAYANEFYKAGKMHKGIYCHACSKFYSATAIAANYLSLDARKDYPEVLNFLISLIGNPERYVSKDEQTDDAGKKITPKARVKAPLSNDERVLLGFMETENHGEDIYDATMNFRNASFKMPNVSEKYITMKGMNDFSDKEYVFFNYIPENKMNLDILYNTDREAYNYIVLGKAYELANKVSEWIKILTYVSDVDSVMLKYQFENIKKILQHIIEVHEAEGKEKDIA